MHYLKKWLLRASVPVLIALSAILSGSITPITLADESQKSATADREISQDQEIIDMIRQFWKRESGESIKKVEIQPFKVPPRKDQIDYFPCQECHEDQETNPKERKLSEEHEELVLDHGEERFWCLTCHLENDRDFLVSLKGEKIDLNDSYLLCGQCHSPRQKDWYMGAHGKRVGRWHGERLILLCVECHNPHSPSIKPRPADPPPRKHLREIHDLTSTRTPKQKSNAHDSLKVWEKILLKYQKEQSK